jgi:hypothetical protein
LTVAQVDLLRDDNVTSPGVPGFADLGITTQRLRDTICHLTSPKRWLELDLPGYDWQPQIGMVDA